ncbi:MAG: hypothetical protein ABIG95_05925 [Candidatus Woesearchaeota archaeon]
MAKEEDDKNSKISALIEAYGPYRIEVIIADMTKFTAEHYDTAIMESTQELLSCISSMDASKIAFEKSYRRFRRLVSDVYHDAEEISRNILFGYQVGAPDCRIEDLLERYKDNPDMKSPPEGDAGIAKRLESKSDTLLEHIFRASRLAGKIKGCYRRKDRDPVSVGYYSKFMQCLSDIMELSYGLFSQLILTYEEPPEPKYHCNIPGPW